SVVLPEPLQPARPMMRMRHYSSPERVQSVTFRYSPRDESESARWSAGRLEFRDSLVCYSAGCIFPLGGWALTSPLPSSLSAHRLWCSFAQLTSTVPSHIASNAPSIPMVPI